jgi:ABC-type xylose transport system permease subunit
LIYFLYIVLAILLPIFNTLLVVCGNWSNTVSLSWRTPTTPLPPSRCCRWVRSSSRYSFQTSRSSSVGLLNLWLFFWFFALYLVYAIIIYHKLLWYFIVILFLIITKVLSRARRRWDRQALGGVRKSADNVQV